MFARFRPPNDKVDSERHFEDESRLQCMMALTIKLFIYIHRQQKPMNSATIISLYQEILSCQSTENNCSILFQVYKGINASVLAYGQSGSGKTYTMFGKDPSYDSLASPETSDTDTATQKGMIPRAMMGSFSNWLVGKRT